MKHRAVVGLGFKSLASIVTKCEILTWRYDMI